MDFATLLAAVDFTTVGAALISIGALKVAPIAVQWGVRKVLGMLGR